MASLDETNHAAVSLIPTEDDPTRWVSTLAPLTLLKAASKHAARLNEHRMLYTVSDETNSEDTVEGRGGSHGQAPTRGGSRGGSGCGGAEYDSGMGSTNYGKRYTQDDSSRCSHPGAPNVTPR